MASDFHRWAPSITSGTADTYDGGMDALGPEALQHCIVAWHPG